MTHCTIVGSRALIFMARTIGLGGIGRPQTLFEQNCYLVLFSLLRIASNSRIGQ